MRQIVLFFLLLCCFGLDAAPFDQLPYNQLVQYEPADSTESTALKQAIVTRFPESEATWNYAHEEFYDRLYPVWTNLSRQVPLLDSLLVSYPQTSFRRTIYLYLASALHQLDNADSLATLLVHYRTEFPLDYQSWYLSTLWQQADAPTRQAWCGMAVLQARNPWKPQWYPTMQWELEHRSAPVKAVQLLASQLTETGDYKEALTQIDDELTAGRLGVDDETTYAGLYLQRAKALQMLGQTEPAIDAALQACIAGDARNRYMADADSLLRELLAPRDLTAAEVRNFARQRLNYSGPRFEDVTTQMGLDNVAAGRVAWGDFNNDGFQDLLLGGSRVFINRAGQSFDDVTAALFPDMLRGNGGLWADFNNDSRLDLVTKDPEAVWLNQGDHFQRITGPNAIGDNGVSTEGIGIADFDGDDWLDIYFANYEDSKDHSYYPDEAWRGRGEGRFYPITDRANLHPADDQPRAGRGVTPGDFDLDGDIDIYVSNYRLQQNLLYVNDGTGHFSEKAQSLGLAGDEVDDWWGHTIGSQWGDYDCDGDFDLITANLAHPRYIDFSNKTRLYRQDAGQWTDVRAAAGIRYLETHSEPCWADFNNDGYLDLVLTCVYQERPTVLYHNDGNGHFVDVSWLAGVRHTNGWGAAVADFDNDGRLDLLIAGGHVQLYHNVTHNDNNWLSIQVQGSTHGDAIGTQILHQWPDGAYITEIHGGKGTTNQSSLWQHIGVGQRQPPYRLRIRDASGVWTSMEITEPNQQIIVR